MSRAQSVAMNAAMRFSTAELMRRCNMSIFDIEAADLHGLAVDADIHAIAPGWPAFLRLGHREIHFVVLRTHGNVGAGDRRLGRDAVDLLGDPGGGDLRTLRDSLEFRVQVDDR